MIQQFSIKTRSRDDWIDLTATVRQIVRECGLDEGIATVFIPHTTAGVTIQENADPPLRDDITRTLDRIFPWHGAYQHCEDNAAAHMKTCYMGSSVQVIFENGALILGTWQNIFLCEFDGPRTRNVVVRTSN
jgi:secondary thiamine-phosphate synthase enzyme